MSLLSTVPVRSGTFDLVEIPFSRSGSWLDISPVTALHTVAQDLHVVSHIQGIHAVLKLTPRRDEARVPTRALGASDVLTWTSVGGSIEATFENGSTIRLRGDGLGLRIGDAADKLTPFTGSYLFQQPGDGAAVLTSYETGRRYRITALRGAFTIEGAERLGQADRWIDLPDTGEWEVAIEEITASRSPYASDIGFDDLVTANRTDFETYLEAIAPWRPENSAGVELAAYVMWSATVSPQGLLQSESVLMSKHWMDKVWSWDHCFNAIALLPAGLQLAIQQYRVPFEWQDEAGALPDSVAQNEVLYNFVKPPIHGWGLSKIRELSNQSIEHEQLTQLYDGLAKLTRFWLDYRRAPGRTVPYYEHGNDSGWDDSTMFDRDRLIEAPDLAAFLIVQLDVLADLAPELGRTDDWTTARDQLLNALVDDHWDGTAFVARSVATGRASTTTSLLNAMPVFVADRLPKKIGDALAAQIEQHLTEWGLATELVNSAHYESDGYWRGPIWAPSTALIEDGLRRAGYTALADEISRRFRRLCEQSGFAENFDAITGEGLRDRAYTWTASVYLNFVADAIRRGQEPDTP